MRGRAIFTLVLGLLLAGGAVYLVEQRLDRGPPLVAAEPAIALARVVVAAKELKYSDKLRADFLREAEWPAASAPKEGFGSIEELLGDGKEERVVLRGMVEGEPVLKDKISGFGGKGTLGFKLAAGKRAFTIRVNDVSGVAGFITPGDKVDIMLTRGSDNGAGQVTDMILQQIVILGINQITDEERDKPVIGKSATVEVTPEEAQKLALAMQVGSLSLALRNFGTAEEVRPQRVNEADLFPPSRQDGPTLPSVRVRRGTILTLETLD